MAHHTRVGDGNDETLECNVDVLEYNVDDESLEETENEFESLADEGARVNVSP